MAAKYEHKGYTITREPAPTTIEEGKIVRETTVWAFDVCCPEGNPLPIVVEALDRKKGLRETRRRIDAFIAAVSAVEPESAFDAAQLS